MSPNRQRQIQKINSIAERILTSTSIQATTEAILENLKSELDAFGGVIFLQDTGKDFLYTFAYTKNNLVDHANKILARDPFSIKFSLKQKKALLVRSFKENRIFVEKGLVNIFAPVINRVSLGLIQRFLNLKTCLTSPVRISGKPVGCLFMAFQREILEEEELALVQLYANLSGIALENNRNLEKLRLQYEAEKEAAAILTHELKTPIAIAYNSSELLRLTIKKYEGLFSPDIIDKIRGQQMDIQESIRRMNRICNSIFSMTEVENNLSKENQKINLAESMGRLITIYKAYPKKGLEFVYQENIKPGIFYGPVVQFEQVVSIILENAFKYTKEGYINVDLTMNGKEMRCVITDTGPGIPDLEKDKIFERFYRGIGLKNQKKERGLGLGLYLAKKITEKLHGSLILKDNPNTQGTMFTIIFPVYKKK